VLRHLALQDCRSRTIARAGACVLCSLPACAGCLQEKLPWSEEVLVSKSELEERRNHVAELEQQVAELTMQTEYQLRLKELHLQVRQGGAALHSSAWQCWEGSRMEHGAAVHRQ